MPLLTPPNAGPCNTLWSVFPTQPFHGVGWYREQSETELNNHSFSLSCFPPAGQSDSNGQANVQGYTRGALTALTSLPIPEIQYNRITTNSPAHRAVAVHPLVNEERTTELVPIGGSGKAYGMQGTDRERWVYKYRRAQYSPSLRITLQYIRSIRRHN